MHVNSRPREAALAPFTEEQIARTPEATGVYMLYRGGWVIYVGVAVQGSSVRAELERHRTGAYGPKTRTATSFDYELTRHPVVAKHEYLELHKARHNGRLPSCNGAD
jgi:hypothetical protein